MEGGPRYVRKQSDTNCHICTEHIEFYAIGECGHNEFCWKCVLKNRMKMHQINCLMCRQPNKKVLITRQKYQTLATCSTALYDPETDVDYEDHIVKSIILKKVGYYCQICSGDNVRKFPNMQSLTNHYESYHKRAFCDMCLEHKPELMCDQPLFGFDKINMHRKVTHPMCHFCYNKSFYDMDSLNKHYVQDHHFCDLCKKLGKKIVAKSKRINLPDFEVFRDWLELREHQQKEHFCCDKPFDHCRMIVFESAAQLSSHYLNVHGQQMPVRLEFVASDSEESFEEEKKENAQLTKENYRDLFPTLQQANKADPGRQRQQEDWPSLFSRPDPLPIRPATAQVRKEESKKKPNVIPVVRDKAYREVERKEREKNQQIARRIESMIEESEPAFEYREEYDTFDLGQISQQQLRQQQRQAPQQLGGGGKKMKKVIVVNERKKESPKRKEEVKRPEDYPQLAGSKTSQPKRDIETPWNQISDHRINQSSSNNSQILARKPMIDKQEFPSLPKEQKAPKLEKQDDRGGTKEEQEGVVKKKNRKKKNKGEQVADWSKLETVNYNQLF